MSPLSTPNPSARKVASAQVATSPQPVRIGVVRTHSKVNELPFPKATIFSMLTHVLGPVVLAFLVFLCLLLLSWLMHFNLWDWFKPKPVHQDMEFVIVQDTQALKPQESHFRGEHNQEAGGKPDPMKPPAPVEKPSASRPPSQAKPVPQQVQPPQPAAQAQAQPQATAPPQPTPPKPPTKQPQKQAPETAQHPLPMPTIPLPMAIEAKGPVMPQLSQQGPIASAIQGSMSTAPGPASLPIPGSLTQSSAGAVGAESGSKGNPEEGNAKTPGVATQQADFAPYMVELKRRLTRNWRPPRGEASKRVVLRFEIAKDGRLLNIAVDRTSGEPLADDAAVNAVKVSAPFRALPPEFEGESVPILFTFDYTVYGRSSFDSFSKSQRVNR